VSKPEPLARAVCRCRRTPSAGARRATAAGHSGLLAGTHKKSAFSRREFGFEHDFVGANADMFGFVGDLLVFLMPDLPAVMPPKLPT
jgi:hypothetical protein